MHGLKNKAQVCQDLKKERLGVAQAWKFKHVHLVQ